MSLVLNDAQEEAVREAYDKAIKYLVTAPTDKHEVEKAMAEIIALLNEVLNPHDSYFEQYEMFGGLLAKWDPREQTKC